MEIFEALEMKTKSRKPTRAQKIVADLKLELLQTQRELHEWKTVAVENAQMAMDATTHCTEIQLCMGELIVRRTIEHMRLSGAEIGARLILVDHLVAHFSLRPFPEPPADIAPVPAPLPTLGDAVSLANRL